ncbi:hypothetical protein [Geobacter sp.]|uniref:hypothetical protein n=1 Tax=Geobacter sp. TaxID=46610 RepID=UPI00261D9CCB|nr:hypothetical protein [Geobacter sp.]
MSASAEKLRDEARRRALAALAPSRAGLACRGAPLGPTFLPAAGYSSPGEAAMTTQFAIMGSKGGARRPSAPWLSSSWRRRRLSLFTLRLRKRYH